MNKGQTKKVVLGGIGLIALIYVYFSFFIGPLNRTRADLDRRIGETQGKVTSSKENIEKARKTENNARASLARNTALRSLNPDGAPIAWFPPKMKNFLSAQHLDRASVRLEGKAPLTDKELEKWQRYTWLVDLPQADFHQFGRALAELENTQPLLAVKKIRIHTATEDPEMQQIAFTAESLIETK